MQPPESADGRRAPSTCSTTAPRRTTTVGCMAGLLRLFSPYHRSHHRKRLTAKSNAARQQQQPPSSSPPPLSSTSKKKKSADASSSPLHAAFLSPVKPNKPTQQQQPQQAGAVRRRRSCDAPRSPTIAPEHRRRASCDSPRPSPPAIVARLMGLEESAPPSPAATAAARPVLPTRPPPPPPRPQPAPETAAEKRRKLLGALEKCDEDLKTLRRIIAAVRAAEMRAAAASDAVVAPPVATPPGNNKWVLGGRDEQSSPSPQQQKPGAGEQYPSPDSVLDNAIVSSPRFPCRKRPSPCSTDHDAKAGNGAVVPVPSAAGTATNKVVKPSRTFVFSGDYCKIKAGGDELHTAVGGGVHHHPTVVGNTEAPCTLFRPRLPRAAGAESWRHHRRLWEMEAAAAGRVISRATVESVAEVWGQQQQQGAQWWECAMVAAALERAILQDLVTDMVTELLPRSDIIVNSAAGCRKRLCF